jgi:hypothetical protein
MEVLETEVADKPVGAAGWPVAAETQAKVANVASQTIAGLKLRIAPFPGQTRKRRCPSAAPRGVEENDKLQLGVFVTVQPDSGF